MTKNKNTQSKGTKRALLISMLSMLLCLAMLVGSIFAWFSDSVTTNNKIVAGKLDVALYHSNSTVDNEKVNGATKLFVDVDGNEIPWWEPGMIVYENFTVKNEGTLALKYTLSVSVGDYNTVTTEDGEVKSLKDVLKIAVIENGTFEGESKYDAWLLDFDKTIDDVAMSGNLDVDDEGDTYAIVIYWDPSENDNDFNLSNGKTSSDGKPLYIDFGVTLVATQDTVESDGFGDDYDADAEYKYPTKTITNGDKLREESSKESDSPINIELGADITDPQTVIAVAEDSTVNVSFNGNTITVNGNTPAVIGAPGATVTLSGGTIKQSSTATMQLFAGRSGEVSFINANGGTIILDNMTIETDVATYVVSTGEDGYVSIIECEISANTTEDTAILVEDGGIVEVDGFSTVSGKLSVNEAGTLIIYTGYFTDDPTEYLSEDESGYSVAGEPSDDFPFWAVARMDEGDFEDPFGDE